MTDARTEGRAPRRELAHRLHNLAYSVVYPAFLGSFIVALLQAPATSSASLRWGLLLAVYFALQQIEGAISGEKEYGIQRFLYDTVEILLMIAAFDALRLVRTDPASDPVFAYRPPLEYILPVVLAYPAVVRILALIATGICWLTGRSFRTTVPWRKKWRFYGALTCMSLAASVLSYWHDRDWSYWLIVALLAAYLILFSLGNEIFKDYSWRRADSAPAETPTIPAKTPVAIEAADAAEAGGRVAPGSETAAATIASDAVSKEAVQAPEQPAPAAPVSKPKPGEAERKSRPKAGRKKT